MNVEALQSRLFQVVHGNLTHSYYGHVVAKHKLYMQLIAGVGLDDLLKQFVRTESGDMFKQRKNLTQHIVTSVCRNLLDVRYKIPNSNSARPLITYEGKGNEEKIKKIQGILANFWGEGMSWSDYMSTRVVELEETDPNAFVVFEFAPFDETKELVQPMPYEVSSIAAVDYKYINNELQYLTVKDSHTYSITSETTIDNVATFLEPEKHFKKGYKYTTYGKDSTIKLLQVSETKAKAAGILNTGQIYTLIVGEVIKSYVKLNEKYFEYIEIEPHNLGTVPAFRTGLKRDLATQGNTCVNPLHAIEPYLLKTVNINSQLDLVAALLAHPQQIKRALECQAQDCFEGHNNKTKKTCSSCQGTGMQLPAPTPQSVVLAPMQNKEELIPLKEYLAYNAPPVDIIEWQEQYVDNLTNKAKQLLYNSDTFTKKQVAETATGKTLDMQNVYDTLHPFAVWYSRTWPFGVTVMAKLADLADDLIVSYTFGKDFKLKTLTTLIQDAGIANTLNNQPLVRHFNEDIAQIIFSEKPLELQRFLTKEMYNPFTGKQEKEIHLLLVSSNVLRVDKVLYSNQGKIFDVLELADPSFYNFNRDKQIKLINAEVASIIERLEAESETIKLI